MEIERVWGHSSPNDVVTMPPSLLNDLVGGVVEEHVHIAVPGVPLEIECQSSCAFLLPFGIHYVQLKLFVDGVGSHAYYVNQINGKPSYASRIECVHVIWRE